MCNFYPADHPTIPLLPQPPPLTHSPLPPPLLLLLFLPAPPHLQPPPTVHPQLPQHRRVCRSAAGRKAAQPAAAKGAQLHSSQPAGLLCARRQHHCSRVQQQTCRVPAAAGEPMRCRMVLVPSVCAVGRRSSNGGGGQMGAWARGNEGRGVVFLQRIDRL